MSALTAWIFFSSSTQGFLTFLLSLAVHLREVLHLTGLLYPPGKLLDIPMPRLHLRSISFEALGWDPEVPGDPIVQSRMGTTDLKRCFMLPSDVCLCVCCVYLFF